VCICRIGRRFKKKKNERIKLYTSLPVRGEKKKSTKSRDGRRIKKKGKGGNKGKGKKKKRLQKKR